MPGELWHARLVALLNRPGWTAHDIAGWISTWVDCIVHEAALERAALGKSTLLPGRLFDAVPKNLIIDPQGHHAFFDLEWDLEGGIGFGHLVYRAIVVGFLGVTSVAQPKDPALLHLATLYQATAQTLGLDFQVGDFTAAHAAEAQIQDWVNGGAPWFGLEFLLGHHLRTRPGLG